jgi:hypothetical protein
MANLRLTYSDIYTRVSVFIGTTDNDSETVPTGNALTKCKSIVQRGLRQFLYPIDAQTGDYYEWSFLRPLYTINILDGKWRYILPEDFSSIITDPTYKDDENFKQMVRVTPDNIMNLRAGSVVNYAPYYYSIVTSSYDPEIGEFDEIWFYPEPDSSYPIQFYYKSDPLKATNATDYLPGGVKATEAILESCLSVAEVQEEDTIGIHTQLAQKLVQELIIIDAKKDVNNTKIGNLYCNEKEYINRTNRATLNVYNTDLT